MTSLKTVEVGLVWLNKSTEGPWSSVQFHVSLPPSATIVEVGMGWRPLDAGGTEPYPCLRYEVPRTDEGVEIPQTRVLYAVQDGGYRDIPTDLENLGVVQWPTVTAGVHVFGVRGPIQQVMAPAE